MLRGELESNNFQDPDDFDQVLLVTLDLIYLIFHLFQHVPSSLHRHSRHDNVQDLHLDVNARRVQSLDQILDQVLFQVV